MLTKFGCVFIAQRWDFRILHLVNDAHNFHIGQLFFGVATRFCSCFSHQLEQNFACHAQVGASSQFVTVLDL